MRRRNLIFAPVAAAVAACTWATPSLRASAGNTLRGKLVSGPQGAPALSTASGVVTLAGDEDTVGVLKDKRLAGSDFEVRGKLQAPGQFAVDPIHTKAMFVHKDGKPLLVTYWCDVCAIRTYTPGLCWCCRDETELQLQPAAQAGSTQPQAASSPATPAAKTPE